MTPAAMGQGRERKARLPPRQTGFAVAVGVRLPLSQWPCWWVCRVPECHQIDARPARGCAGCWRAYPWAGGLPGVRVGFRWAVPWAGCLPGGRAGAGGPTCGPCACWVPVGACWVLVCLPVARGCAGWPAWWPACWCACPWFRDSKTLKFTQRHTPEPATVPPQAGQCVPFRHIEFNVQGQQ